MMSLCQISVLCNSEVIAMWFTSVLANPPDILKQSTIIRNLGGRTEEGLRLLSAKGWELYYRYVKGTLNHLKTTLMPFCRFYPYEAYDSYEKLRNAKTLPPPCKFYNTLTGSGIKPQDYATANKVFHFFQCKNMLDYSNTYLISDTFLLGKVKNRNFFFHFFNL